MRKLYSRRVAFAGLVAATSVMLAAPAEAQFRDFFSPFGGNSQSNSGGGFNPFGQRPAAPQVYESVRAPLPRKVETPPTSTVVVIGDTLADWLGYGLEVAFADTPEVGIVRKIKYYSGLVRYEAAHGEVQDWSQAINELLAQEKPSAIVVTLGVNDRLPLREPLPLPKTSPNSPQGRAGVAQPPAPPVVPAAEQTDSEQQAAGAAPAPPRRPGAYYEFHSDDWARLYNKRIDEMIAALKAKGVPVLWVGLPAIRGARSTTDMSYLDELYRPRAEKAGIAYVDIWDGFVDDKGQFAVQGPDFEGQTRRLRTYDGVNFTKSGAEKLARYVEHELRRVLTTHVAPVALPGPDEQSKGNAAGARPAVGPVVPLTATATSEGGDLLGAASRAAPANSDPVATRVLSHGDALAAPSGRADDFSWPRADASVNVPDTTPEPVVVVPPAPAASPAKSGKGEGAKSEEKKSSQGKPQATPNGTPARPGQPRAALDSAAPRTPSPLAPSRD